MPVVRGGVAQLVSRPFARDAVEAVVDAIGAAANQGVQLLVFPEAFVGGYPRGAGFGTVVGERAMPGRAEFAAYAKESIVIGGPETDAIGAAADGHGVHVVLGCIERVGSTLYCATVLFDDAGRIVGRRRKVMPTGAERLVWGQGDGSTVRSTPTRLGRVGVVICWENLMPALRLAMYADGVDLWCAPTADSRDTQLATMRHIAVEGRCFVLAANQFTRAGDLHPGFVTGHQEPDEVVCRGASVIVDPFGTVLAGPLLGQDGLLVADLDLDLVTRARYDFDPAGHYARPDLFQLRVDRRPQRAVQDVGAPTPDPADVETP